MKIRFVIDNLIIVDLIFYSTFNCMHTMRKKNIWTSYKAIWIDHVKHVFAICPPFLSAILNYFRFHFHFAQLPSSTTKLNNMNRRIYFHIEQSLSFETGWWSSSLEKGKFLFSSFSCNDLCEMESENWKLFVTFWLRRRQSTLFDANFRC